MSRPDLPERVTALEIASMYERQRIDRLERMAAEKPPETGARSGGLMLDGPAIVKLGIAGGLVLVMVLLKAVGRPDLAADLSSAMGR